jgi:hypothetical protein
LEPGTSDLANLLRDHDLIVLADLLAFDGLVVELAVVLVVVAMFGAVEATTTAGKP